MKSLSPLDLIFVRGIFSPVKMIGKR
jgi:hypothetical protein